MAAVNLTYVGKLAGFVSALNVIPFVDPAVGGARIRRRLPPQGHGEPHR